MHSGWNPTRRNKHIGTKYQGYGANNRMVIPESWHTSQRYWEKLTDYVLVERIIRTKKQLFFIEPTREGWFYPCTVDDSFAVLSHCSFNDINSFNFIVLRQPTRKQSILNPVWGRAQFFVEIDDYRGSAIVLEALTLDSFSWRKSLDPEDARELERLRSDGHNVTMKRREYLVSPSFDSLRETVLYRTLLHEIGHHVDYRLTGDSHWKHKIRREKEDFAHHFAEQQRINLINKKVIPIARILNARSLELDKLKKKWFVPENCGTK